MVITEMIRQGEGTWFSDSAGLAFTAKCPCVLVMEGIVKIIQVRDLDTFMTQVQNKNHPER